MARTRSQVENISKEKLIEVFITSEDIGNAFV